MTAFDLVLRGGLLVDGTGAPARPADVGLLGDRILAVGDLSAVGDADVETVLDAHGRVVAPGFIDPHGHSDGSVLVDGALASHLHDVLLADFTAVGHSFSGHATDLCAALS